MIKLINATIHKYKSIEKDQSFDVNNDVTVLVGMNESGKTAILEALAKVNYFDTDQSMKFNSIYDYPRKQKKQMDKTGEIVKAVTLRYELSDLLANEILDDIGIELKNKNFEYIKKYDNTGQWNVDLVDNNSFIDARLKRLEISDVDIKNSIFEITTLKDYKSFLDSLADKDDHIISKLNSLEKYFNDNEWNNFIDNYITSQYLIPNLPKFMYYDDYYMLPGRVSLEDLSNTNLSDNSSKTAKALMELSDIDLDKLLKSSDFEEFIAELEATQLTITEELFKYWTTNKNLNILFKIDKVEEADSRKNTTIKNILDIRVQNQRSGVSLPLTNRSKGFNWFFSFLVWFLKIQENADHTYILLLDEPGLNLHAKAQSDLLKFISDLSQDYQIIYTTHSPFMIESDKLQNVRTVLETNEGTKISDSIQEKDPNTLFPLQAALGYDLAQNLFISKKNLVVEGVADLVYLTTMSALLEKHDVEGLREDITIVPVGGADKVATFVSLLRGNNLKIICLLDTFKDQSSKARLNSLIAKKIIKNNKIIFYHDITETMFADIEDLFSIHDYLMLYNEAFNKDIKQECIKNDIPLLQQLKEINDGKDFNHYLPATILTKNISTIKLSEETKDNFLKLFKLVNKAF